MNPPKVNDIGRMERKELVRWIERLAGDELENISDWMEIAESSMEQLRDQLKTICKWYELDD